MRKDGVLAFQAGVTTTARERERERVRVGQSVNAMILETRIHDHRTLLALMHKLFCVPFCSCQCCMPTPGAPLGIESAGKQQAMVTARTKPVWCVTFVSNIMILHANKCHQ